MKRYMTDKGVPMTRFTWRESGEEDDGEGVKGAEGVGGGSQGGEGLDAVRKKNVDLTDVEIEFMPGHDYGVVDVASFGRTESQWIAHYEPGMCPIQSQRFDVPCC